MKQKKIINRTRKTMSTKPGRRSKEEARRLHINTLKGVIETKKRLHVDGEAGETVTRLAINI